MAFKYSTKFLLITLVCFSIIPAIAVSTINLNSFKNTHNTSLDISEEELLSQAEGRIFEFAQQRGINYENFIFEYSNLTLSFVDYMQLIYENRSQFGEIPIYGAYFNESGGGFPVDPWTCSMIHMNLNSTHSVKLNETGSWLITLDETTNTTNYASTTEYYPLTAEWNESIDMTAPLDNIWRAHISNETIASKAYFGAENGFFRRFPWIHNPEKTNIYNPRIRPWYIEGKGLNEGEVGMSKPYIDWGTKSIVITFSAPVFIEGTFIGVMALDVFATTIINNIFGDLDYSSGYQFLIDGEANIVARTDVNDSSDPRWDETYHLDAIVNTINQSSNELFNQKINTYMNTQKSGIEQVQFQEGGNKYVALVNIPSINWYYGVVVSVNEIIEPLQEITEITDQFFLLNERILWISLSISIAIVAIAGWFVSREFYSVNSKIETIFKISKEGIIIIDFEGKINLTNTSFDSNFKIFFSPTELNEILHGFINPDDRLISQRKVTEPKIGLFLEFSCLRFKNGYVIYVRDISELEKHRLLMIDRAKVESLIIMTGGIGHDLNNYLGIILGNLSLMKSEPKFEEHIEEVSEIEKAIENITKIGEQLLTFSKGGQEIVLNSINIQELVSQSVDFALHGSSVKSNFKSEENLPLISCDSGKITQVITNLVINASQAMNGEGFIEVELKQVSSKDLNISELADGEYIEIAIQDHGMGMSEEIQKKIFQPFFTTKSKGNGIGLTSSLNIIKKHNGMMKFKSNEQIGTTFYIYLPIQLTQ